MRPTMRLNRSRIRIPSPLFFLSGPYFLEALLIVRLSDPAREGDTNEARSIDVQGNPQVVSYNDRYTYFTYPYAAHSWLGHVKQSYFAYCTTCIHTP